MREAGECRVVGSMDWLGETTVGGKDDNVIGVVAAEMRSIAGGSGGVGAGSIFQRGSKLNRLAELPGEMGNNNRATTNSQRAARQRGVIY